LPVSNNNLDMKEPSETVELLATLIKRGVTVES